MSPVRVLVRTIDAAGRRRAAWFGVAHGAERLALFAVALVVPRDARVTALLAAGALALLTIIRALLGSAAQTHAKAYLHVRAGQALLTRDLFRPSALEDDDPEAALLDGIDTGARALASLWPQVMADAAAAAIVAVVLALTVPLTWLAAFALAITVGAITLLAQRRATVSASERAFAAYRPVVDRLVSILAGRLEIVANGARPLAERRLASEAGRWADEESRFERSAAIAGRLPILFGASLVVIVLVAGATAPLRELAVNAVVLAFALPPFAGVARGLHELGKIAPRVAPLASLLDGAPAPASSSPGSVDGPPRLVLTNASFRYAGATVDALDRVDAAFLKGRLSVLVGANGSGKSTLLRALLSLEPLRGGALSAGDVVVKGGDALRAATAYLPQRPYLSERATVRESFELFFERAPAEAPLVEWLTRFGMLDVLRAKNADDPLAVRIGRLSSGQKQRVALARFCALDRPVWLLDEPDASLDAEGLALLESILREERANRIIVVAAHSPSIARIADQVIACDGGRVTARSSDTPA